MARSSAVSQRLGVPGLAGLWGGSSGDVRPAGSLGRAGPALERGRRPLRRTHSALDSRRVPASMSARAGDGSKSLRVLKSSPPPWLFFRYLSQNTLVVERMLARLALPAAFAGGRLSGLAILQKRKQL